MTVESKHTLDYCRLCTCDRVLCATCGNNCCNGGYGGKIPGTMGTIDDHCPDCPEAYDHQDLFLKDSSSVSFAKDIRSTKDHSPWKGLLLEDDK